METIILTKGFEKQISLGFVIEVKQDSSNWGYYLQNETFIVYTLNKDSKSEQGLFFVFSNEDPKFYSIYHGTFIKDDNGEMIFDATVLFRCISFSDLKKCILKENGYGNCLENILNVYSYLP